MIFSLFLFVFLSYVDSQEISFKLDKNLDIPKPNVNLNTKSINEDFDPSLPDTEPPDSVKYFVKETALEISKGLNRFEDFDIESYEDIKYLDLIMKNAKEQNFDLELALAIIKKESNFDPKIKSSVGAVGLMQLLPETAKWLGLRNTSKLIDPDINVKYGIKYLRYLFSVFSPELDISNISKEEIERNDILKSIAAYNAGPGNVKKYDRPPHNGIPPFPETKNYVKKVPYYFIKFKELNIPKN
jgi:soluble lytic murein transglycosylase-like protein